jgi:hypothetical protein
MPYIVVFMKCPSHVLRPFVNKAIEAYQKNLFPDDESVQQVIVQSAGKITEDGVRFLSVTLVKEGKLEEAWNSAMKEMVHYSEIEGVESSVEVWATVQEGLQSLGIEIPES